MLGAVRAQVTALSVAAVLIGLLQGRTALAENDDVVVLPTALVADGPHGPPILRLPSEQEPPEALELARRIDAILREAAQDLGLVLDVSERPTDRVADLGEERLIERARSGWVVSARLRARGSSLVLRILVIAPGSKVVMVRSEAMDPQTLEVRTMILLRDLIQLGRGASPEDERPRPDAAALAASDADGEPTHSRGRAVLGLNASALGGYLGLALQRASTSGSTDDRRLVYPLVALGAGVGLGASMLIADEWDVGLGDAWFLAAGTWWPTVAGLALADGYGVSPPEDRYVYSLLGTAAGLTLSTTALSVRGMSPGGALLAHSGGAFGLLLGGLTEAALEGSTELTPRRGGGLGALIGVVGGGLFATQVQASATRVLYVDMGATLGGLTSAAAASPLILDEPTPTHHRLYAGSIALGTLVGGGLGYLLTRPSRPTSTAAEASPPLLPSAGVIGISEDARGRTAYVYGATLRGRWE